VRGPSGDHGGGGREQFGGRTIAATLAYAIGAAI
jgi:hypothetical protein